MATAWAAAFLFVSLDPAGVRAARTLIDTEQPGFSVSPTPSKPQDQAGGLEAPLDPSAPLDPLPDLGLEWPDLGPDLSDGIVDTSVADIADTISERRYIVHIEGLGEIDGGDILVQFHSLSTLEADKARPANAAQMDRRARADAELLGELLRAHGYYDALVRTSIDVEEEPGKIGVTLFAEPGPLYHFTDVELPGIALTGADEQPLREAFGVQQGAPVDAAKVAAGAAALRLELGKRGYAFAEVGELDIAVDHETRTATLRLPVEPQGARRFGHITIVGEKLLSARHIQNIARFREGQPYSSPMVEDLRRALIATGLVSTVSITPEARLNSDRVDLAVKLQPAPLRTIAVQAGYGTGEGARAEISWQHRNLLPPEGAMTFRLVAGTREQLAAINLRRNNFKRRDQILTALASASHVERTAYEADTVQLGVGIERQSNIIWQKQWTWSLGTELIASDEKDVDIVSGATRVRTFLISALPMALSYDGSNDLLDPTRGFRLSGHFSPEASFQNGFSSYAKAQVDASFYQPIADKVVIAGRARLGTIIGESRDNIAPSRRFYAGGGSSVRGYGFQRLGPRDLVFDDPIGGRSLVEFSLEARVRTGLFGGALGIVPFIDAGNIYTSSLPKLNSLRFGAGIGIRYHTNFGPIRVDIGTPLNRQSGDSRIAVYVSLGQAF